MIKNRIKKAKENEIAELWDYTEDEVVFNRNMQAATKNRKHKTKNLHRHKAEFEMEKEYANA